MQQQPPPPAYSFGDAAPVAMQLGANMVQSTLGKYLPFASALWLSLRYYFDVNTSYVQNKLRVLLVPFRHTMWKREPSQVSGAMHDHFTPPGAEPLASPSQDVNAPDLYLPLMSFVTFVLMTGLLKGTRTSFTPEVLNEITTSCLVTQLLEMGVIKLGMYLLNSTSLPFLDLLAFTGYKYINLVINTLVGLLFGSTLYYVVLLYTGAAAVIFMANTLRNAIPENSHVPSNAKRNYLLIGISFLQFVLIWWLGYSGDM